MITKDKQSLLEKIEALDAALEDCKSRHIASGLLIDPQYVAALGEIVKEICAIASNL